KVSTSASSLPRRENPEAGIGKRATRAVAIMAVVSIFSKFLAFFAQLALGKLLNPKDFGLFGLATSAVAVVGIVGRAGVREVLIARAKRLRLWATAALTLSLTTSLVGWGLICAVSPLIARMYKNP